MVQVKFARALSIILFLSFTMSILPRIVMYCHVCTYVAMYCHLNCHELLGLIALLFIDGAGHSNTCTSSGGDFRFICDSLAFCAARRPQIV